MTRKEDLRAIHSKEKIKLAFTELLKEKGFSKTTVSDIIKLANVNRSTFYAHYVDKFDLLDKFEEEMLSQISNATEVIPTNITQNGFIHGEKFREYITKVLTIVSENKEIFTIIYGSEQGTNFQKKLFTHMDAIWSAHHISEDLKVDAEYVQIATVGMICSLIEKWIEASCSPSIPQFSNVVSDIVGSFIEGVM